MYKFLAKLFLIAGFLFLAAFAYRIQKLDVIKTENGLISGTVNQEGDIHIFRGIPFAAPPLGNLRWKAPQPAQHWTGVRKCEAFGPSPMQASPVPFSMWSQEFLIPKEPISEDCLYLNVWTGAKSPKEKRPVLVWIYGGGFSSGGSAVPIYDGEAMAKKGIVFVSFNYRVGIFGFFAHPELTKESPAKASGNYGLLDQIAALQWVRKNIAAFGGDPANVTIAGQSAGSMSVNCLVASPLAKGLFRKAIAESGASFSRGMANLQQAEQEGSRIAGDLQAASLADLRNMPAEELLKKAKGMYRPVIDGYVIPESIPDIFNQQKENDVTLLTGWNENEGLMFGPMKKAADFQHDMEKQYGAYAKTMLQYYPATSDTEAAASQLNMARDIVFGVQNYTWANMESSQGKKVYVYRFTRKVPGRGEYAKYGAFHTGEVPYAYGNLKFVDRPWEPVDYELEKIMSSFWANFITSGNPNGKGLPEWPRYETATKEIMDLGPHPMARSLPDSASLNFMYARLIAN
jgi:para-nitrobenzyl esterase